MSETQRIESTLINASPFTDVVKIIRSSRSQVLRMANTAFINIYWKMRQYLSNKIASAEWGYNIANNWLHMS